MCRGSGRAGVVLEVERGLKGGAGYDEPCCFDVVLVEKLQEALGSYCASPETCAMLAVC